jgi:hypothetical protein
MCGKLPPIRIGPIKQHSQADPAKSQSQQSSMDVKIPGDGRKKKARRFRPIPSPAHASQPPCLERQQQLHKNKTAKASPGRLGKKPSSINSLVTS